MSSSNKIAPPQRHNITVFGEPSGVISNQQADNTENNSAAAEILKNDKGTPEELSARFVEKYRSSESKFVTLAQEFARIIKKEENWPKYREGPFKGEKIKFQISSRAKDIQSLEDKLKQECESRVELVKKRRLLRSQIMAANREIDRAIKNDDDEHHTNSFKEGCQLEDRLKEMSKKKPYESMYDIHISNGIWDLIGVRILSYYPDDIPIIVRDIMKLFDTVGTPQVRDAPRNHRQLPKVDRAASYDQNEIADRLSDYVKGSWTSKSADEIERDWKHAGYRAVHLHVKQKGSETRPEHMWKVRAEIQLTTPVMHAWSEIEHDIIYKNRFELPQDQTTDRMIDAFNGLAITSEILLQQLQKTLITAKDTNEKRFKNKEELEEWLRHWSPEPLPHSPVHHFSHLEKVVIHDVVEIISCFLESALLHKTWNTRKGIGALLNVTEFKTYRLLGSTSWDALFAVFIKNICKSYALKKDMMDLGLVIISEPQSGIGFLYKLLFVSNIFSNYWFLMSGDVARFWNSDADLREIDTINGIFVGKYPVPKSGKLKEELDQYANKVLGWDPDAALEIAISFAKLGLMPQLVRLDMDVGISSTVLDETDVNLRGVPLDFTFLIHAFCNSMYDSSTPGGLEEYDLGTKHLRQMADGLERGEIYPRWERGGPHQPAISLKVPESESSTSGIEHWCHWGHKDFMGSRYGAATDDQWMAVEKRLKLFEWRTRNSQHVSTLYWGGPRATLTFLNLVLGKLDKGTLKMPAS